MGVFVYIDDVDRHYEVAKAAGADIVHPPKDADYGRNYWANDPEGIPGSSPRRRRRERGGAQSRLRSSAFFAENSSSVRMFF